MIDGMEIQQFSFTGKEWPDYVLIKIDVGQLPPNRAKSHIERARNQLSVCKVLDEFGILFDIIGVRSDGRRVKTHDAKITGDISEVTKKAQEQIGALEKTLTENVKLDVSPSGNGMRKEDKILNRSFKGATLKSAHDMLKAPNSFDDAMDLLKK